MPRNPNNSPLAQLRAAAGLTQKQVAGRIGVATQRIGELEIGKTVNPTLDLVRRLARVYGVNEQVIVDALPTTK